MLQAVKQLPQLLLVVKHWFGMASVQEAKKTKTLNNGTKSVILKIPRRNSL